jgi:hypothetical protein
MLPSISPLGAVMMSLESPKSSLLTPSSVQLDGRPRLWRLALTVLKSTWQDKDSMNGFHIESVIEEEKITWNLFRIDWNKF